MPAGERLEDRSTQRQGFHLAGEIVHALAVDLVRRADLQLRKSGEQVQAGQRDPVKGVDARRMAAGDGVEPTDAARATGRCAIFVADVADALGGLVEELRREGTLADPAAVGLVHADRARQTARPDP